MSGSPSLASLLHWGARDGAVVRAHSSNQCGAWVQILTSTTCRLSLLLVLSFAPRIFFSGFSLFSKNICKFIFDQQLGRWLNHQVECAISKTLFIYLFTILSINTILNLSSRFLNIKIIIEISDYVRMRTPEFSVPQRLFLTVSIKHVVTTLRTGLHERVLRGRGRMR